MHTAVARLGYLQILMCCFLSFKLNTLFVTVPIPGNTLVLALERTQESDNIEDTIQDCIGFFNENYGFTFVFWYLRGEINNQYLIDLNLR